MKTKEQTISQIKRNYSNVVWINFTATGKDGINYLSGHDVYGNEKILSSDGIIFEGASYKSGYLELTYIDYSNFPKIEPNPSKNRIIRLSEVKAIDNSDLSIPAPSKNVSVLLEKFEINI